MNNIFQSNITKVLAVATVVLTLQHVTTSEVDTAVKHAEANFQKASLSCQNWKKEGYGELMGCPE